MNFPMLSRIALLSCALWLTACSSDDDGPKTDADYSRAVALQMHDVLGKDVKALHTAAVELKAAAPNVDRGWTDADTAAITATTNAWIRARSAYERSEGAIAPIFPDIDAAIDARYDDFLETYSPDGDPNLFDGERVTGMHAIERILFAKTTPQAVIDVEATLPGYVAARWPESAEESKAFKNELCAQLVTDTAALEAEWASNPIDLQSAFGGLIALMNEQREKVRKAASAEEESRYAQRTLADIRDNLAGTRAAYALFQPWVRSKQGGADVDASIQGAFKKLEDAYASLPGDAFPPLPADFSAEAPTEANLATDFGRLFAEVESAANPNREGSVVHGMNQAAVLMNFPEFVDQ
ncbi:MAG TPA: EfeM/EfeO family lipoprotein [Polyangiaceae bacterium]|nr:EfeM/EfeO family lipoprotein [Polyangiaceae bacterium]